MAQAPDLDRLLDLAVRAAASAAALLGGSAAARAIVAEAGRDIKIAADAQADAIIVGALLAESEFSILTEESGLTPRAGEYRWIVDPLDGSFNFARGLPMFCVSIALWHGEEPVLGVIHDPARGEVFTGIVGRGAQLNGAPIAPGAIGETARAVCCTGLPVALELSPEGMAPIIAALTTFKKVRMLGSAALSLAYVACGRADAYFERNILIWDVAAGVAIVRAAGGSVVVAPGTRPNALSVHASNGALPRVIWDKP